MFISKEWLESYVEINEQVNVLAERITRTGIEVDDIIDYTKRLKTL